MSDDAFNSPFSGLKKNIRSGKKKASPPVDKKPQKVAPPQLSQDFSDEDDAASAMFMAAMGRPVKSSGRVCKPDENGRSMGDLLAEQASKKSQNKPEGLDGREYSGASAQPPENEQPGTPAAAPFPAAPKGKKNSRRLPPRPEDLPDVELDGDEADSFAKAMQGVKPVDDSRGRALAPPAPQPPVRHKSVERDYLAEFTEGKYEFALEYTEEFFEGHVMGMDPLVVAKLRAGQYSPEMHIDLHGMNSEQAYEALLAFVKSAYNQGRRNLIVVTGRGKNSPGGLSVLRQNMHDWLTREPLRRVVLAFCTAQPKDGGAGALYVMLRKYKKNQGKIRWERGPWEERPLI